MAAGWTDMPLIGLKRNVQVFTGVSTNTNGQTIGQLQLPNAVFPFTLIDMQLQTGLPATAHIPIPR